VEKRGEFREFAPVLRELGECSLRGSVIGEVVYIIGKYIYKFSPSLPLSFLLYSHHIQTVPHGTPWRMREFREELASMRVTARFTLIWGLRRQRMHGTTPSCRKTAIYPADLPASVLRAQTALEIYLHYQDFNFDSWRCCTLFTASACPVHPPAPNL
jgi:hypothetical protein